MSRWLAGLVGGPVISSARTSSAGSFKIRGAYVRIARLSGEERAGGSSPPVRATTRRGRPGGEHARREGDGVHAGGGADRQGEGHSGLRRRRPLRGCVGRTLVAAGEFAAETGAVLIHPFDHPDIVAGQGTVGLEILHECPDVRTVVVGTGGGGLLAGIALAVKDGEPDARRRGPGQRCRGLPAIAGRRPASGHRRHVDHGRRDRRGLPGRGPVRAGP